MIPLYNIIKNYSRHIDLVFVVYVIKCSLNCLLVRLIISGISSVSITCYTLLTTTTWSFCTT